VGGVGGGDQRHRGGGEWKGLGVGAVRDGLHDTHISLKSKSLLEDKKEVSKVRY